METTCEIAILRHVAAGAAPWPDLEAVDEDRLTHALLQHRLVGRFLRRVTLQRPPWCRHLYTIRLKAIQAEIARQVKRRIAALREIENALFFTQLPVIPIKGFMTYAITGDPSHLRSSGDLDILFSDSEALWEAMERLGYQGKKFGVSTHEYGTVTRGDMAIEPHAYFPAFSYPENLAQNISTIQEDGVWRQTTTNRRQTEIRYEHLLEHSHISQSDLTQGVRVPNAALAALILCAHIFRHFLQRPARNLVLMLGELAEVNDLIQHPSFDNAEFTNLIETFQMQDSLRFVRSLFDFYFSAQPKALCPNDGDSPASCYPQPLTYFGGWGRLESVEMLLDPLTTDTVVRALDGNTISLADGEARLTDAQLSRVIVQSASRQTIPFALSIAERSEGLSVEVSLCESPRLGHTYQVNLYGSWEYETFHYAYWRAEEDGMQQGGEAAATLLPGNQGCAFHFLIPWATLARRKTPRVPLLIIMTRHTYVVGGKDFETADPVIVVPCWIDGDSHYDKHPAGKEDH